MNRKSVSTQAKRDCCPVKATSGHTAKRTPVTPDNNTNSQEPIPTIEDALWSGAKKRLRVGHPHNLPLKILQRWEEAKNKLKASIISL